MRRAAILVALALSLGLSLFAFEGCATVPSESFEERQTRRDSLLNQALTMLTEAVAPHVYDFALVEVERPSDASNRYSDPITSEQAEDGLSRYVYGDSLITVAWIVDNKHFNFDLTNRGNNSIRVIWNEAAFVDSDGLTSRVMHEGVRYAARNESQPPSVIPRGGRIADVVIPTDRVVQTSGDWGSQPLVQPSTASMGTGEEARTNVGARMSILLPLEVQGVVNEYLFTFEILGVQPAEDFDNEKYGVGTDSTDND